MARRGRPPGTDSAATRARIIEVARIEFAERGYEATAVTSLAAAANLAPSAIYHYFGGKAELYEAVFDETAEGIWGDIGVGLRGHPTLRSAFGALVTDSRNLGGNRPHFNDFLALVPMESRMHPGFAHLLDRRSKYQDETFGALADLGLATGELAGFTHAEATEVLRSLVMGWFFETHFRGSEIEGSGEALLALIDALADRSH